MVPTFLGEHFSIECVDCEFVFPVDATKTPNHGHASCPNCGFTKNPYQGLVAKPPTQIQLNISNKSFNRWDVAAFQFNETDQNGVKRIVGLPNENIEIRDGNIFVNGNLAARNWAVIDEMKVLVFDSKFAPSQSANDFIPRLEIEGDWKLTDNVFTLQPQPDQSTSGGYLHFQPINCYRGSQNRKPIRFVQDNYGYNQSNSRNQMNNVDQLLVHAEIKVEQGGDFAISISPVNRTPAFFVLNSGNRSITIEVGGEILAKAGFDFEPGWQNFLASNIDGIYRIFLDGKPICEAAIPRQLPDENHQSTTKRPVSILANSSQGKPLRLRRLKIYRDIYYTARGETRFQLGENEFLLFGDNSPVSVDGRTWSKPSIHRKQIHGIVEHASQ